MQSSLPLFLISMPQLGDPNFTRSVLLLLQHNQTGALGLVINNPSELTLGSFVRSQDIFCQEAFQKIFVFRGGPVEPEKGWILHTDPGIAEAEQILPGLFLSTSVKVLKRLLENGNPPLRLILGYAGWGAGQLEKEMKEGSWLAIPASLKLIFSVDPSQMWKLALEGRGINPLSLVSGVGVH